MYCIFTLVLSEAWVQCPIWLFFFWISLTSCFPAMLLTYFLNDFEIVPVAPIITGITFVFTFHMRCISILRSLYFRIFSASFLITFISPEIATFINIHVPFSLSPIIMSGLLLLIVLSVWTRWFHNMVTLSPWLVSPDFGTSVFCQIVPLFPCICWSVVVNSLYHDILCTVLPILGLLILCGLLSRQIVGEVCTLLSVSIIIIIRTDKSRRIF